MLSGMYTLKQMEAFYWSAELGSFAASSKKLHTTQSAIAKRVAELEVFSGAPLLDRKTKQLVLTPRGRQLLELAQETLELSSRVVQKIASPQSFEGVVRLGVTELVGLTSLAPLIDQVSRSFPQLQLMPEIDGGVTLYQRLGDDTLDMAIMPGPFWSYEYDCVPLGSIRNEWMASPALGLDPAIMLAPRDLVAYPVITQPTNSALSHLYDAWFTEQGLSVNRVLTCNNMVVVARLTMLGLGISYLPPALFTPMVERGELVQLRVAPHLPRVHYYAVFKKNLMSPNVAKVIEIAQAVCHFDAQAPQGSDWVATMPAATRGATRESDREQAVSAARRPRSHR